MMIENGQRQSLNLQIMKQYDEYNYFQNECTILTLEEISLRLKECQFDIILKKNKENLLLCSKLKIFNGRCMINHQKEFYVEIDDSKVMIQIFISTGSERKYGGQVPLNILEWEENVIQKTQAKVINSPDKNSFLNYSFYYFKDDAIIDNRTIFLPEDLHKVQYQQIQSSNLQLNEEKSKLEQQLFNEHKKNEVLQSNQHELWNNRNERKSLFQNQKNNCMASIYRFSEEFSKEKEKMEGLMKLVKEYGLKESCFDQQS